MKAQRKLIIAVVLPMLLAVVCVLMVRQWMSLAGIKAKLEMIPDVTQQAYRGTPTSWPWLNDENTQSWLLVAEYHSATNTIYPAQGNYQIVISPEPSSGASVSAYSVVCVDIGYAPTCKQAANGDTALHRYKPTSQTIWILSRNGRRLWQCLDDSRWAVYDLQ